MRNDQAPRVVFVRFEPRDRLRLLVATVCFAGLGAAIMYGGRGSPTSGPLVMGLFFIGLSAITLGALIRRLVRYQRFRTRLKAWDGARRGRRRLIEAMVNLRMIGGRRWIWSSHRSRFDPTVDLMSAKGVAPPLCIVDAKLRTVVRRCRRTDEFLECELAGQTLENADWMGYLVGGLALLIGPWALSWVRTGRGWSGCVLILFSFGGLALVSVAVQRLWIAGLGGVARGQGFVVGPGAIAKPAQLWRTDECLTIVRKYRGKVFVIISDRAAVAAFVYLESPPDSFHEFWKRWMHPKPRPDLVAAVHAQHRDR